MSVTMETLEWWLCFYEQQYCDWEINDDELKVQIANLLGCRPDSEGIKLVHSALYDRRKHGNHRGSR